jgi:TonB family protein
MSMAAHLCFVPIIGSMWPEVEEAEELSYALVTLVPVAAMPDPEERDDEEPEQQFVELSAPETEETPPDKPQFADRFDRRVERETVANDLGEVADPSNTAAAARGLESAEVERTVAAAVPSRPRGERAETQPGLGERQTPEVDEGAVLPTHIETGADPTVGRGAEEAVSPEGEGLDLTAFNVEGREVLTARQGSRLDHLQLDESDRTLVNSAQSMYWSFFRRMKRQVQGEWDPTGVYRQEDPSGRIYQRQDRYTVLAVTLAADGGLAEAAVERSCGLDFLDEEAVRAFRSASPFPNVPEGLKDEEGFVDVRFGFLLSLGGIVRIERIPEF